MLGALLPATLLGLAPRCRCTACAQMTHHQLQQQREADEAAREAESRERQLAAKREVSAGSYSRLVEAQNTNREEDVVDARGVEAAIDALASLSTAESPAADKHPEKCVDRLCRLCLRGRLLCRCGCTP